MDAHNARMWGRRHPRETPPGGEDLLEAIQLRAYELWLARIAGGRPGSADEDWAQAEAEMRHALIARRGVW